MNIDTDLKEIGDLLASAEDTPVESSTDQVPVSGNERQAADAGIEYSQVLEARQLLEVEIAGLAASRCTPDDIDRLAQALEEAELNRSSPERFPRAEDDFRLALARATQNAVFPRLLNAMTRALPQPCRGFGPDLVDVPARRLVFHRAVFDQVAAGDAEGARRAMRGLLDQIAVAARAGAPALPVRR